MTEEREIKKMTDEMYEDLLERNKLQISGLNTLTEEQDRHIVELEKENAELKEKVSYLEDNLRVARKDRENLQLKVGKGLKDFIKDCPYSALKLYANGYYVEQLTKAKEIIQKLYNIVCGRSGDDWELIKQAEQFLREVEK